ncbi:MAG: phage Gp37/Gp68 family protein [Blastomonas sp.]
MAEQSAIEWTDATVNFWWGCTKVGPGCDFCYAENRNARWNHGTAVNWGPGAPRRRTSAANWRKPQRWNADAAAFAEVHGRKQRVFCASLADVFDNAVHPGWRSDLFDLIYMTPNIDWLLLTKRIGNVAGMMQQLEIEALPVNVWLGATIVNQQEADRDVSKLITTPAAVRFLSMEPLLGPVDMTNLPVMDRPLLRCDPLNGIAECGGLSVDCPKLDWIIVGGESGPGARPMANEWAQSIVDQCKAAGVPVFVKQLSSGGAKAIKDLDQFPEGLRVREWPR